MTEEELREWRASMKARSEALEREVAKRLEEVSEAKAEEEQLAKTDQVESIHQLLLKHRFRRVIGIPSDFGAECIRAVDRNDVAFFHSVAKALEQLLEGDARNDKRILKPMLEVFRDLRAERHRRFLEEAETEYDQTLTQLSRSNSLVYKQLEAFRKYSPHIDIRAVLRRSNTIPTALREHLAFLNQPSRHTYGLPTKKEVREETIRRMKKCYGRDWEPPDPKYWGKLFKEANLAGLPEAGAGRPPGNYPQKKSKSRG